MNEVFVKLSRHDPHRIELKTVFETNLDRFEGATDVYLFLPKSVGAASLRASDLESDFSSRLRLGVPHAAEAGVRAVEAAIKELELVGGVSPTALVEASQVLAAVFSETLKLQEIDNRKDLLLAFSLLNRAKPPAAGFEAVAQSVDRAGEWLNRIRAGAPPSDEVALRLLDEYLSHLFIQYTGRLELLLEETSQTVPKAPLGLLAAGKRLEKKLRRWLFTEQAHRERSGHACLDGEALLLRVSHLKKFFHSPLFVDLDRRESQRRWMESAAAGGAGVAAVWGTYSQHWGSEAALPGLLLFGGVAAYVVKDRIKEWSKQYFGERVRKRIPDLEHRLLCDESEVGFSRQWIRTKSPLSLDEGIRELRAQGSLDALEAGLPEDVLHYRIEQGLSSCGRARTQHGWAAQQLLRIGLERYLSRMDDPYKEVLSVRRGGKLDRRPCHRVYHFYLVVRPRYVGYGKRSWLGGPGLRLGGRDKVYRVVLDKSGIERVEGLSVSALEARSASEPVNL